MNFIEIQLISCLTDLQSNLVEKNDIFYNLVIFHNWTNEKNKGAWIKFK